MSSKDKILISDLMEGFVSEVPAKPFVTFCVACNKGIITEDMLYEKGKAFHKECFEKFGKNFPAVNQDLLSQSTNAKVELVQLKNLKIRMTGAPKPNIVSRPKTKKKTKRKIKKQRKNKRIPNRKKPTKKRTSKKKTSRKGAKSSKKNTRRTKRRISKRKKTRR
ncbi:MAG TPA: LIM domain-containing protein [Nitrosopumilaceae archaeon]|nr:LIM domain-containing protein [Nitrosopumilaceae archaeon]